MDPFIACCGLDCERCDARLATVRDDEDLRRRVAARWSELNHVDITPEMIRCEGCRVNGAKTPYAEAICPIRPCAAARRAETCADCADMDACGKLVAITRNNPDALRNLNAGECVALRERPELLETAAAWFHEKWGVPESAYRERMQAYLDGETEYGWYLCLVGGGIAGGLGVIDNDFHDRKDLTPNICAVYTEEARRGRGIAGRLLKLAVEDLRAKGISPVYLVTDHTGFYERYGWEFLCMAQGDGEPEPTRVYIHR